MTPLTLTPLTLEAVPSKVKSTKLIQTQSESIVNAVQSGKSRTLQRNPSISSAISPTCESVIDQEVFPDMHQKTFNPLTATIPIVILVLTLLLMISLSITMPLVDEDGVIAGSARETMEVVQLVEMCVLHFLCCLLLIIYWEFFAWYIEQSDVFIALFYLSIIGGILLQIVRYLKDYYDQLDDDEDQKRSSSVSGIVSPRTRIQQNRKEEQAKSRHWAMKRQGYFVVDIMIKIVFVGCVAVVFVGSIAVASFAELSNTVAGLDVWLVFLAFIILAHLVMINPFLSASVLDLCGGFILTQCLASTLNFGQSLAIILGVITVLHFTGSCTQWYIGGWSSVQLWLNKAAPILLLTASDSVYKDAGILKAGLIGGIFPDTINGLNQGRMGMDFRTQFFSEWSAIPNAIALTVAGAILGSNDSNAVAVLPLVGIVAVLMNIVQGLYALSVFNKAMNTPDFWHAYEKWAIVHHFIAKGYIPTQYGWENDVYHLAKHMEYEASPDVTQTSPVTQPCNVMPASTPMRETSTGNVEALGDMEDLPTFSFDSSVHTPLSRSDLKFVETEEERDMRIKCLYEKISYVYEARRKLQDMDDGAASFRARSAKARKYDAYGEVVRQIHYKQFNETRLKKLVDSGYLIYDEEMKINKEDHGYFAWNMKDDWYSSPAMLQRAVFLMLVLTAGISYYLLRVQDFDAVRDGFESIQNSDYWWVGFIAFTIHLFVASLYWHIEISNMFQSWCCKTKNSNEKEVDYENVESMYVSPPWSQESVHGFLKETIEFKSNEDSEWGVKFRKHKRGKNRMWIVLKVDDSKHFGVQGVRRGWILYSINDVRANFQNRKRIKKILHEKPSCKMTFDPKDLSIHDKLQFIKSQASPALSDTDFPIEAAVTPTGEIQVGSDMYTFSSLSIGTE